MKSNKEADDDHKGKVKKRPGDEMGHTTNKERPPQKKMKTTGHCSDNQFLIAMLLKQAGDIFCKLHVNGEVLKGDFTRGYKVINSEAFAELVQESKVLVNYTDCFVLKDPSDKMTEIFGIDRDMTDMDPYGALCFVTGILDTLVSNVPKRNIPPKLKLKTKKQKTAIDMAKFYSRLGRVNDYAQKVEDNAGEKMYEIIMSKKAARKWWE